MGNCLTVHPPPPNSVELHLAPSNSIQLISASIQLSATPSALLDPKCCTQLFFSPKTQHIRYLGGANSKSRLKIFEIFLAQICPKMDFEVGSKSIFGQIQAKKVKIVHFPEHWRTHGILEVLILNLELEFQNSDPKIYFWTNFNQNCCFWTYNQGFFKHLLLPLFGGKNSIFNEFQNSILHLESFQ